MKNNKKVFVYLMLFVVFIAQVIVSKVVSKDAETDEVMAVDSVTLDTNMLMTSMMATNTVADNTPEAADVLLLSATIEPHVTRKIVYQSTLSSRGEVIDDLSGYISRSDFDNKLISYCEAKVYVYAEPDTKSDRVGVMYSRSQADVLEKGEEWSKISSGNVVGYVRNVQMLFGMEAERVAPLLGKKTTRVDVDQLFVYESDDANSPVICELHRGDEVHAYEEVGMWMLIECDEGFGYVPERGILSSYDIATAWTMEEEAAYLAELARIEAERRARELEEKRRIAEANNEYVDVVFMEPMVVSDEEKYLLACIVEWEAGWEPYEGKLAVANVVLNRVRSPRFKQNTITDVIYAPGQFTGVRGDDGGPSYRFRTEIIEPGPRHEECYKAAEEALAGVNNISDYLFFMSMKKAVNYLGTYSKYHIINNHCFYAK